MTSDTPDLEPAPGGLRRDRVVGLDAGSHRIGVAYGSRQIGTAQALAPLARHGGTEDWPAFDRLIAEWRPDAWVVGLPLTVEGAEQPASVLARALAAQLASRYGLPVFLQDERHSSQEAAARFASLRRAGTRRRRDADSLDSLAAVIIVERWFDASAPGAPTPLLSASQDPA